MNGLITSNMLTDTLPASVERTHQSLNKSGLTQDEKEVAHYIDEYGTK